MTSPSVTPAPGADVRVVMVAGEASGDLLAGLLLGGLRQRWPDLVAQGIGGPRMAEQGFQSWWPHDRLSVHGFSWELLRRYREILGIRRQLKDRLLANPPHVFIGIDAPDFNLDLEADLRAAGVRTVHFVCPSVWAWRAERLDKIRHAADHVLCIFPFEPELLAQHGIGSTYVGHPLARVIPLEPDQAAARRALGYAEDALVVAVLPGSRPGEIEHLAPRFFAALAHVKLAYPAIKFVVPAAPGMLERLQHHARSSGLGDSLNLVQGQSHTALAACDATLIASGTATLEAALFKRPMVIGYHMGWLSWQLMRRKRLQPWVGLPNILCRDFVVPELLQDAATPAALARELLTWLDALQNNPAKIQALQARFTAMHHQLRQDTQRLATHAIEEVLRTPR